LYSEQNNRQESLSDKASKLLREAIASGELQPNTRLVESQIAQKLGLSRTPVREALKQLEAKGYVSTLPNGRMIVTDHTPSQIRNIFEIREALETTAIKLACQRSAEHDLAKAEEYYRIGVQAALKRDIQKYVDSNSLFHEALLEGCDNKQLMSLIRANRDQYFDRRVLRLLTAREWRSMNTQHEQMLEAVRIRNERKAQKVIQAHARMILRVALRWQSLRT